MTLSEKVLSAMSREELFRIAKYGLIKMHCPNEYADITGITEMDCSVSCKQCWNREYKEE